MNSRHMFHHSEIVLVVCEKIKSTSPAIQEELNLKSGISSNLMKMEMCLTRKMKYLKYANN